MSYGPFRYIGYAERNHVVRIPGLGNVWIFPASCVIGEWISPDSDRTYIENLMYDCVRLHDGGREMQRYPVMCPAAVQALGLQLAARHLPLAVRKPTLASLNHCSLPLPSGDPNFDRPPGRER